MGTAPPGLYARALKAARALHGVGPAKHYGVALGEPTMRNRSGDPHHARMDGEPAASTVHALIRPSSQAGVSLFISRAQAPPGAAERDFT